MTEPFPAPSASAPAESWMRRLIISTTVGAALGTILLVIGTVAATVVWYVIPANGAPEPGPGIFAVDSHSTDRPGAGAEHRFISRAAPHAALGAVLLLTLLRLALILLLAVLFLQPALRWKTTRTSAGSLWVVVDQSPSMQATDVQATDPERLHWAEGLGLVDRGVRPDDLITQIKVLQDELDALAARSQRRRLGRR